MAPAFVVPLLLATNISASASVPSNDDISNATVITSLPTRSVTDLSQATWNDSADSSRCSGRDHSVWYSFTPAGDEQIAFDPSASNQTIAIDAFTGSPGSLSFVGCGQGGPSFPSGFILNAAGGTNYWIMASPICCVPIPTLDLAVYVAEAPQATLTIENGTVDRGGNVTVVGTLDCAGTAPTGARLSGNVRQSVGRLSSVTASIATTAPCATAQRWTALAQPLTGKFVGGPATVNATAFVCNAVGCTTPASTAVITLHR